MYVFQILWIFHRDSDIPCMFPVKKHETTPPLRCFAMLRQGGGNAKEAAETAEVLELLALAALPEELELCLTMGDIIGM